MVGLPRPVGVTKPKAKHAAREENRPTAIAPHAAAALRLLLFTSARLREILHLRWEHVDSERKRASAPRGVIQLSLTRPAGRR